MMRAVFLAMLALALPLVGGVLAQEAPANDNFNARFTLIAPELTGSTPVLPYEAVEQTAAATLEEGETSPCGESIGATVWYEIQASQDVTLVVDTEGSDFPPIVAVYQLAGLLPSPPAAASLSQWACDDGEDARAAFPVSAGGHYFVQVGGGNGATGTLRLRIDCEPGCAPPNDSILAATPVHELQMPFLDRRSTVNATLDEGEPLECGNPDATVWYMFAVSEPRDVIISASGEFDIALAGYEQADVVPSPPEGIERRGCAQTSAGGQSTVSLGAQPGRAYWVQVGGQDGARGIFEISITCDACPLPGVAPDPGQPGQGGGNGQGGSGPPIAGPDTGSGGYR